MKLFKRKATNITDEAIAVKIASRIIHYQRAMSDFLNRRTKNWTPKFRLCMLIGCCLLFGAYFLHILVKALQNL